MKFVLPRPEGGDEHGVVWYRHHNCQNAKTFRAAMEDPDIDLLQFPVGLFGYTMPMGIPFAVEASSDCMVCGARPSAWFEWAKKLVIA